MRPYGTPQQLEQRRRRAIQWMTRGRNLPTTAATVQASVRSVGRWWHVYQRKGMHGLRPLPAPGRPARRSLVQKRRVIRRRLNGA